MKKLPLALLAVSCLSFGALAAAPDVSFNDFMQKVGEKIKAKSDYIRIPIDTEKQSNRFITLYSDLYKGKITHAQFIKTMKTDYPDKKYEKSIMWLAAEAKGK
ncbi:hypothetical protein N9W21_04840 [Shewanella sp.]|nr:hypothetical protein [Shewanella sp.]